MQKVYTPCGEQGQSPQMRHPLLRFLPLELTDSLRLAWRFFLREISSKYRQSLLGIVWAIAFPLFAIIVLLALHGSGIISLGELETPYPAFVITGITLWGLFATTVSECTKSLAAASGIISKINFPRSTIVLAAAGMGIVEFLIRLPVVIAVVVAYGVWSGPVSFAIGIAAAIPLFLFALGIGFIFSVVAGVFRDLMFALPALLGLVMILTPILYPISPHSALGRVNALNPLNHLIVTPRDILLGNLEIRTGYILSTVASVAVLLLACRFFRLGHRRLAERI
jgi:lipopolysaccharide transport system permease protein